MRELFFAALFAIAVSLAATADAAQSDSADFFWHHGSAVFVGKASKF